MNEAAIAPPGVMPSQQPIDGGAQQRHPVARQFAQTFTRRGG